MPDTPTSPVPPSGVGAESTSSVPVSRGAAGTGEPNVAVYRLELPYARPPLRSNDSYADPRARGRMVKQVRNDTMLLAKSAGMKPGSHMFVQLHYAPGRNTKMDSHNLHPTVKACVDALARGKRKDWVGLEIVPDDTDEYVSVLNPVIHRPPEPGPRCWLIVKVHHDTDELSAEQWAVLEADGLQSGVDTPGCDCTHDGMGRGWHLQTCSWLRSTDSPAGASTGSHQRIPAGAPLDWQQVAVKLGRLGSDWRLLSTAEAEALRVLVDAAWDRDEAERDVAAERMADAADRGAE